MATLSHIAVHPIKALDPVSLDAVSLTDIGGLSGDRAFALVEEDGTYFNGKQTAEVHSLGADIDLETNRVTLRPNRDSFQSEHTFDLDGDRDALERWLSTYFGRDLSLEVGAGGSQTDGVVYGDSSKTGPTLVSAATLREAASWYDEITPTEMRLRLRANLVVEGVPAFWEDRLVADGGRHVQIGDVTLVGTEPIPRCVVPTRHPHTGEQTAGFREHFIERREAMLPTWADRDAFKGNLYSMTVGTQIPETEREGEICVGDDVQLID